MLVGADAKILVVEQSHSDQCILMDTRLLAINTAVSRSKRGGVPHTGGCFSSGLRKR